MKTPQVTAQQAKDAVEIVKKIGLLYREEYINWYLKSFLFPKTSMEGKNEFVYTYQGEMYVSNIHF